MADSPNSRHQAESRLAKAQKRAQDGQKAMKEHLAADQAIRDRTAKLRALRLAKEAAEEVERAKLPPKVTKKKAAEMKAAAKKATAGDKPATRKTAKKVPAKKAPAKKVKKDLPA